MTRRFLLVLCVLMLGAATWFALSRSETAAPTPAERDDAAAASRATTAEAAQAGAPAPEHAPERSRIVEAAASAPSAPASIPAEAKRIEVTIVDKASQQPVPDADVAWMDQTTYQRVPPEDQQRYFRDPEIAAQKFGWKTRSNVRGVATVHLGEWTSVIARSGSRFGATSIHKSSAPPPEGYRVELVEDRTLLVQVLDALGRPAFEVPVAIALHDRDGAFLRLLNGGPIGTSEGPDGMARVAHLQQYRERNHGGQAPVAASTWRVRLHVPGVEDAGVAFAPEAPPAERIVLRLPPTGSITVRVELAGRPMPSARSIGLYIGDPDDREAQNHAQQRPVARDGIARFAHVPIGQTFTAVTYLGHTDITKKFSGPNAQSQETAVTIEVPADCIVLTGRVLDERREPMRDTALGVRFKAVVMEGNGMVQTDQSGQFWFFLGKPGSRRASLELFTVERQQAGATSLRATLAPRELKPGVQDVGDLVLEAGPLVVAGRFVEGEKPCTQQVQFYVERERTGRGRNPRGGRASWEQVRDLTPSQGKDGAFEVRGEAAPGRYRLAFPAWDHLPIAAIEFAPGTKDLVVEIASGAPLTASVLMAPELPWGLQGVLVPALKPAPVTEPQQAFSPRYDRYTAETRELETPGRYSLQWRPLPPGSYALELRLWGQPEPLLSIPDLVLPLASNDRRLAAIDLRDKVAVLTVRIVDADAKPRKEERPSTFAFVQPLDPATESWFGYAIPSDGLRMPVRPGPVDLLVASDGSRPREVRGARGEVLVRLEPWPEVELVFADLPALPEGFKLQVSARPQGASSRGRYVSNYASGPRDSLLSPRLSSKPVEGGRAKLAMGDGPMRLAVFVSVGRGGGKMIAGVTPAEVSAGGGPVEVHVPAEGLQKALAELQQAAAEKK